jgi:phage N-6-adenine-methyltransferase
LHGRQKGKVQVFESKNNVSPVRNRGVHVLAGGDARHRKGVDDGNRWLTPAAIVEAVRVAFNGAIDLDPATEPSNPTRAVLFYTKADDGLKAPWPPVRTYVNPPYSEIDRWIDHAIAAEKIGARIYMLVPVRTDAPYHHRLLAAATDVLFLRGRVKFIRPNGSAKGSPAFASMIVGLGVSVRRLKLVGTVYVPTHIAQREAA